MTRQVCIICVTKTFYYGEFLGWNNEARSGDLHRRKSAGTSPSGEKIIKFSGKKSRDKLTEHSVIKRYKIY